MEYQPVALTVEPLGSETEFIISTVKGVILLYVSVLSVNSVQTVEQFFY